MASKIARITLIATVLAVSACGTVQGIGKDISTAGKAISKSAS